MAAGWRDILYSALEEETGSDDGDDGGGRGGGVLRWNEEGN